MGDRALAILLFIDAYKSINDYSPSMREIMDACDISTTSLASHHLYALKAKGLVDWLIVEGHTASRTSHLTEQGKQYLKENNHAIRL